MDIRELKIVQDIEYSYDATDILKIHMVTNKNEDIIIELER